MSQDEANSTESGDAQRGAVGVLLIGHGQTATHLLAAARGIAGKEAFVGVVALDAGAGTNAAFEEKVDRALEGLDVGRGVLVIADLMGSSPCNCGRKDLAEHRGGVLVTGLNLAMLCKLATCDRARGDAGDLAEAIADSARRSVRVSREAPPLSRPPAGDEAPSNSTRTP